MRLRHRVVPILMGLLLLIQLAALGVVMQADRSGVRVFGRETSAACAFRRAYGIPCPNCGMMRSVVLFAHGDVREALWMNPAGPLFDLGLLAAGALLLAIGVLRRRPNQQAQRRIAIATAGYAGLYTAVLLTHWFAELWLGSGA